MDPARLGQSVLGADVRPDVTDKREVSLEGLVAPRIEPEIVQCHYPDWDMSPPDAVADAGLHGVLVVGQHVELAAADGDLLAEVEVELRRENVVVARGSGADALGGPVEAVTWLLRLPGVEGLRAGAIVTTGTLTAELPIARGESWQLNTTGPVALSQLHVSFASRDR